MQEPTPEQYQPPLTKWGHTWRLLLALLISALAWGGVAHLQLTEHLWLFWLDLAGGIASYVLVFLRRRWPFWIALATTLIGSFSTSGSGAGVLAGVSLATRRKVPQIVGIGFLNFGTSLLFAELQPTPDNNPRWVNYTFIGVITFAFLAVGMYIGSRRELLWTLRDRAKRAEEEQGLRVAQARTNERARIAREMHDVLAHRISLVTMHAGALAYREDLTPEQVRESAGIIQAKANEALTDLRQVLGVLRGDDGAPADRPQPTYADVVALVDEARGAGMQVDLDAVLVEAMPEQVGRTVYRVVQEGLTNVRKHAPYAHAKVSVQGSGEDGVTVTIWNATAVGHRGAAPASGMGLVGLAERVQLAGGRLEHRSDAHGFTLTAWLPTS
jgi:signal transduction histidine kinase